MRPKIHQILILPQSFYLLRASFMSPLITFTTQNIRLFLAIQLGVMDERKKKHRTFKVFLFLTLNSFDVRIKGKNLIFLNKPPVFITLFRPPISQIL